MTAEQRKARKNKLLPWTHPRYAKPFENLLEGFIKALKYGKR